MSKTPEPSTRLTHRQLFVLIAMILGSGIVILDGSVVNLALPNIAHNLHASFADLQWVADGYLLTLSALLLLGGSLGDIFGRKRMYLTGLLGFGLSSLLCGLAPNITALIALRVLQGIFGALLVPGALAIINTNFPGKSRGKAIGRWAAWSGIAAAAGPVLGGWLIHIASWRWIFFINVPLVASCAPLALMSIQETLRRTNRHIDFGGALTTTLSLAGITYGLIEGPATHWSRLATSSLAVGLALFVIFLIIEARRADPLMPLRLFRSRNFSGANISTFAMYGALGGFLFALVIYLQNTLGYTSFQTGLSSLPVVLLLFTLSGTMGNLTNKYGPRLFMTAGPLLASLGIGVLYFLQKGDGYVLHVLPGLILFGLGLATTVAPLTTTVMSAVSDDDSGIASGVNNAVSRAASLIVIALLGLLGAAHAYQFAMAFCVALTAAAGILSFTIIRNKSV